jgi:hypothetical protein
MENDKSENERRCPRRNDMGLVVFTKRWLPLRQNKQSLIPFRQNKQEPLGFERTQHRYQRSKDHQRGREEFQKETILRDEGRFMYQGT